MEVLQTYASPFCDVHDDEENPSSSVARAGPNTPGSNSMHNVEDWMSNSKAGSQNMPLGSLPVRSLFLASVEVCALILQVLRKTPDQIEQDVYLDLRGEFQKFHRWNYGLSVREGYLDQVLQESKHLSSTVLTLISYWVLSVCKIPKILSGCDWSTISPKYANLEELAELINKMATTITDEMGRSATANDLQVGSDPQDASDSSSLMSDDTIFDVVEDLKAYYESLQDLTHSLETPAKDVRDQVKESENPPDLHSKSVISNSDGQGSDNLNRMTRAVPYVGSFHDSARDTASSRNSITYSVADSGIGISSLRSGEGTRRSTASNRDQRTLQARNRVWEEIVNKLLPPESDMIVKFLEKKPDMRTRRTYKEGVLLPDVDKNAAVPWVGLIFLTGLDRPQVSRLESLNMASGEPVQGDAEWRINTAASLLMDFEVSVDLSVIQRFKYEEVMAFSNCVKPHTKGSRDIGRSLDPITIDSNCIKIVNGHQERQWDLQSTLIEVDGSSLLNLIVNIRHLICRGGPDMSFEETNGLLDIMMENLRRLFVRSPVLFRMSTRSHIINSKNTRYGINHQSMFRTLTTSQGIREIVSLSAAYYNSLDPVSSTDKTQELIRPRFLQIIVMLLSLLNDDDLADIAEFLEATYQLKADRKHLEMLFLKVIPLMSINSKVFLKSLVLTFKGLPLPPKYTDAECWDIFVERILKDGYLLPGTVLDLGRQDKSWIVIWQEDGFKSTQVFNHLQYTAKGCQSWTINDIPPIEVHLETSLKEVPAMFTDGEVYTIEKSDLEKVTCLTPGAYNVKGAYQGGRNYNLTISEYHINKDLNEAAQRTNALVGKLNMITGYIKKGFINKVISRNDQDFRLLPECRNPGRITKSTAELQFSLLAIAYKMEGRKITTKDAIRTTMLNIREIKWILDSSDRRITEISNVYADKGLLHVEIKEITNLINHAERACNELKEQPFLSDELIIKVLTGGMSEMGAPVWFDYEAWYNPIDRYMHFEATRSHVQQVQWLSEVNIEVTLVGHNSKYYVAPLQPVLESQQADEICLGDVVVLAGKYMILAEADDGDEREGSPLFMSNYLRIVRVEVGLQRGGRNRAQQMSSNVVAMFR